MPMMSSALQPKDFEENEAKGFFLSSQRVQLVDDMLRHRDREFSNDSQQRSRKAVGRVLAGPHGVGKSAALYLLVCAAFARGWYVVYVPTCGGWVGSGAPQLHFLEQMWLLNKDLLEEDAKGDSVDSQLMASRLQRLRPYIARKFQEGEFTPEEKEAALVEQRSFMQYFGKTTRRATLYAFDEHNELFREPNAPFRTNSYFKDYRHWTGLTNGALTYTVYVGSAQFELHLVSGAERLLDRVRPLEEGSEFNVLLEKIGESSGLAYAALTADAKWKAIVRKQLYLATGGVPREMVSACKHLQELYTLSPASDVR